MLKTLKAQTGFSMVEALVGFVVFSVGLLLLVPLGVYSMQANKWSDQTSKAAFYLESKVEELKNQPTLANGNDVINGHSRSWTVQNLSVKLRRVDLQVQWTFWWS
jgi:Tfp pilus assembly protein PilV